MTTLITHPAQPNSPTRNLYILQVVSSCLAVVCIALTMTLIPRTATPDTSGLMSLIVVLLGAGAALLVLAEVFRKRSWWSIPRIYQRPTDEPTLGALIRKIVPALIIGSAIIYLLTSNDLTTLVIGSLLAPLLLTPTLFYVAALILRQNPVNVAAILVILIEVGFSVAALILVSVAGGKEPALWPLYWTGAVVSFGIQLIIEARMWFPRLTPKR